PAVSVSVEHKVRFTPSDQSGAKSPAAGQLHIPLEAPLIILDGIHRVLALQRALIECPAIGNDSIAVLVHVDPTGSRRGQLFSDARRHERPTAPSRRIAFDERDDIARL